MIGNFVGVGFHKGMKAMLRRNGRGNGVHLGDESHLGEK
jgi:hypothetical protein